MDNPDTGALLPVTQADKDAAISLWLDVSCTGLMKPGESKSDFSHRIFAEHLARHRHQSETGAALTSDGREALECGLSDDDIAKLRELLDHTERHLPKIPWRVIPSDGKPIIAGQKGSGNLFRGYIATWKEAELACLAVNSMPALLDEVQMLRSVVSDALKYRTAGGMRNALAPALHAAVKSAQSRHAALAQPVEAGEDDEMVDTPGTLEERARATVSVLSEAQKRAIIGATDLMSNHGGYPFFSVEFTEPWNAPVAQFLTLKSDRLTPLGLAVRQALKDTPVE